MKINKKTLIIGFVVAALLGSALYYAFGSEGEFQGNMFRLNQQNAGRTNRFESESFRQINNGLTPGAFRSGLNSFEPVAVTPSPNNSAAPASPAPQNRTEGFEPVGF